jgi:hypothetical protein
LPSGVSSTVPVAPSSKREIDWNLWADPELGLWLINNYGYGHANLNVDLNQVDPDVVRVFGLEDPETALSEPNSYIDRFQPNRAAYNRAWEEVKAA